MDPMKLWRYSPNNSPRIFGIAGLVGGAAQGIQAMVEAKKARKHQLKILKNQIQYRTKDMRAAGINPLHAVVGGGLGGGGAGAAPMASAPDYAGALRSGAESEKAERATEKMDSEEKYLNTQNEVGKQQIHATIAQADRDYRYAEEAMERARLARGNQRLVETQIAGQKIQKKLNELTMPRAQNVADFERKFGREAYTTERGAGIFKEVIGAATGKGR